MYALLPLIFLFICQVTAQSIFQLQNISQPSINYNSIGSKLGFLGSYDGIGIYDYVNKTQNSLFTANQHLYVVMEEGTSLTSAVLKVGEFSGSPLAVVSQMIGINDAVLILGNYTLQTASGSYISPTIFNTTDGSVIEVNSEKLIDGEVTAALVLQETIYLGGDFVFNKTDFSGCQYDLESGQLQPLPFRGFGEASVVSSIIKLQDSETDLSVLFGGKFDTLGLDQLLNHTVFYNVTGTNRSRSSNNSNITVQIDQLVSLNHAVIENTVDTIPSSLSGLAALVFRCAESSNEWVLSDGTLGSVDIKLPFTVYPSKVRIYNSQSDDAGASLFRIYSFPAHGIMNLTYIDPATNELRVCDAWCPLQNASYLQEMASANPDGVYSTSFGSINGSTLSFSSEYQEFGFINQIPTTELTLTVMGYYGTHVILDGLEVYQPYIFNYANNTLNEFGCGSDSFSLSELLSGSSWVTSNDGTYIQSTISDTLNVGVVFHPNITYDGEYSILMYTPGCAASDACAERGIVNVTVFDGFDKVLSETLLYQNNDNDKFDMLFNGNISVSASNSDEVHKPYIRMTWYDTITGGSPMQMVADKVRVDILSIDSKYLNGTRHIGNDTFDAESLLVPLNGLFEYSIANFSDFNATMFDKLVESDALNATDFNVTALYFNTTSKFVGNTTLNLLAQNLSNNATVGSFALLGNDSKQLLVSGDFDSPYGANIFSVSLDSFDQTNSTLVSSVDGFAGGLDAPVSRMFVYNANVVVIVGQFNQTGNSTTVTSLSGNSDTGLDNLALYNTTDGSKLYSFGSGLTGNVSDATVSYITLHDVEYFVFQTAGTVVSTLVWDITNREWLDSNSVQVLNVSQALPIAANGFSLLSGNFSTIDLIAQAGSFLSPNNFTSIDATLQLSKNLNVQSKATNSSAPSTEEGYYNVFNYVNSSLLAIGGRFTTTSSISNVIFVNGSNIYGVGESLEWSEGSYVTVLDNYNSELFIGFSGQATIVGNQDVAGIMIYHMNNNSFADSQPAVLSNAAGDMSVNAIAYYTAKNQILVGGNFTQAGSLSCAAVCLYDNVADRWNSPFTNSISGVVNSMTWYSSSKVLIAGSMSIDGSSTYFATYDFSKEVIDVQTSLAGLDGSVSNFIMVDSDVDKRIIAQGDNYMKYFNGSAWNDFGHELQMGGATVVSDIILLQLNVSNSKNNEAIFDKDFILVASGSIQHIIYGNLSTTYYNGTNWLPYLYTKSATGSASTIKSLLINTTPLSYESQNSNNGNGHLNKGKTIAASLGFAAATIAVASLLIGGYILFDQKRNGNGEYTERVNEHDMIDKVNPGQLILGMDYAKGY
ncbi:hypothetical protein BABINDRAFT_160772 [Babjeviella inositovora NRRL Y-12698]|uniref:Bud site selection protein RAX2 n=1 Tax=Babjeviella inositovora NRRL Y-12698 TaxID=984486 RepID=A0A1E3QSL2_9ASCO|nr:uncharacterized protein BABINDRAFT_160772 [Babjeviella inositovora NRRL Y-12698]ODQ80494.1 hypothetical protein BABINDRAFT_160772 [Babjeviella inositovora NRRL Y-12698]